MLRTLDPALLHALTIKNYQATPTLGFHRLITWIIISLLLKYRLKSIQRLVKTYRLRLCGVVRLIFSRNMICRDRRFDAVVDRWYGKYGSLTN